jgi:hypothetical protein
MPKTYSNAEYTALEMKCKEYREDCQILRKKVKELERSYSVEQEQRNINDFRLHVHDVLSSGIFVYDPRRRMPLIKLKRVIRESFGDDPLKRLLQREDILEKIFRGRGVTIYRDKKHAPAIVHGIDIEEREERPQNLHPSDPM